MLRRSDALGCLALALLTAAVYSGVFGAGFLNWDDIHLLLDNAVVLNFDLPGILRQQTLGIYHPVTLLSVALEHRFFGLDPFIYHLDNVLLHAANSILVVLFLRRALSDETWLPWLCGLLFAVHPQHVESVAWISERKDLLSTFFALLTLLAYLSYTELRSLRALAGTLALFALALLSKPMAMTVPLLMLALDHRLGRTDRTRMVLEKLPFLMLAIAAGLVILTTQASEGANPHLIYRVGLLGRVELAFESLVFYVSKAIIPLRLSAYYDVDLVHVAPYQYVVAVAVLAGMSAAALARPGRENDARFGAIFFLVALAPVLKIVPFGGNSLFNDRYMYLPSIGLFLVLALPFRAAFGWKATRKVAAISAWSLLLAVFSFQSYERTKAWHDSEALWQDVLRAYPGTALALNNLGRFYLDERNDLDRSQELFEQAVAARPESSTAPFNLGLVYERRGELERAESHFRRAARLAPDDPQARLRLGVLALRRGEPERAIEHHQAALMLRPRFPEAEHNLGIAYLELADVDAALSAFERAVRLRPTLGVTHVSLGEIYRRRDDPGKALEHFETARELGEPVPPALLAALRQRVATSQSAAGELSP